jgi:gliding motility-associated-like protein
LSCFISQAQNLIPNSSFETYTSCPTNLSQVNLLGNWTRPLNHLGSTDFFHSCYVSGAASLSPTVPHAGMGYQPAFNGNGYAGVYVYITNPPSNPFWDYREYIMTPLTSPLVAGVSYYIGFYVSVANKHKYGSDAIGAHLSVGPLSSPLLFQPIAVVPQISNPVGNIITDTVNWTLISGVYTALGGENYLTIGNFRSNANTSLQIVNNNPLAGMQNAYFYIDGTVVEIADMTVTGNPTCYGEPVTLQATGSQTYAWADSLAPTTILSTASTLTVSPTVATTYFVYGSNDTLSYTVNINAPGAPMTINLGNDTTLCDGDFIILDATLPTANYLWQDNSTSATFTVTHSGTYFVTASIGTCSTSDTIQVNFISPPIVNLGGDQVLCEDDTLVLDVTAPNAAYVWQDGSTNSTFEVTQAGTYHVISSVLNCYAYDTISISYLSNVMLDIGPDLLLCLGDTAVIDAFLSGGTYQWQDGSTNPQLQVTEAGQYYVDVTTQCQNLSDTVNVNYVQPPANYLGNDTTACWGTSITLSVNLPGSQTQWQDLSISNTYVVAGPGMYTATTTTVEGCLAMDSIIIDFMGLPELDLGPDLRLCAINNYVLSNLSAGQGDYVWSTGSQDETISINVPGQYFVDLENKCGMVSDTIVFGDTLCDCLVYVPNAFTPDKDEHNNTFGAKFDCTFISFHLTVYNRWGELIWESNDPNVQWDGTFENHLVPNGIYVYKLQYSSNYSANEVVLGHFSLLR